MRTRGLLPIVVVASLLGCHTEKSTQGTNATITNADTDLAARARSAINAQMMGKWPQPRGLSVTASSGVVTLRGTVDSDEDKKAILSAVRSVDGCNRVENKLVVGIVPPG